MKPETEWFRPPRLHEMCRVGDTRRFLLIAEPELGEGIYGVGYELSEHFLEQIDPACLDAIHALARVELEKRIGKVEHRKPEASRWDEFRWSPLFKRMEDGTIEVVPGA